MGLFKKQLLKVIEWEDSTNNTIVHKYEYDDRYAIMKGSQLIVRPSQAAIFVYKGSICDVFTEGSWKLEDGSTPILTKIANWKYAFENPKLIDVYYVNLKRFTQMKWGTANPIMMRDKDFGMIRIGGNGEYSFHVMDPQTFMRECFGAIHSYKTSDIAEHLKNLVTAMLTDLLGECEIPALELAANYLELGETAKNQVKPKFNELGLDIDGIIIRNFKLPESVEKAMDKRTTLGVFDGKMNEYAQYESIGAMRDAAKNPGMGGMFGAAGIGLGVGARVGNQFAQNIDNASAKTAKCSKCGANVAVGAKFCPECGNAMAQGASVKCAKCGASIFEGCKFCPECGTPTSIVCPKCNAQVKGGMKFCPECGAKIG